MGHTDNLKIEKVFSFHDLRTVGLKPFKYLIKFLGEFHPHSEPRFDRTACKHPPKSHLSIPARNPGRNALQVFRGGVHLAVFVGVPKRGLVEGIKPFFPVISPVKDCFPDRVFPKCIGEQDSGQSLPPPLTAAPLYDSCVEMKEEAKLVNNFNLEMISPACLPGAAHWSAQGRLEDDISEVLPYINSRFPRAQYNYNSKVVVMNWEGKKCAFRPNLISVAPVEDREEAHKLLTRLTALVNDTWRQRDSLEPDYEQKPLPSVMKIYTLLPRTNCKECGRATCMAFAADLREGKTELSCCPELSQERHAEKQQKLEELLSN